jgi:hypothetical protein
LILKRTPEGTSLYDVQELIYGRDCEYGVDLEPGQYVFLPRTNGIALKRPTNAAEKSYSLLDEQGELNELFEGALEDIYYVRLHIIIISSII